MPRENLHLPSPPAIDRPGDRWVCGAQRSGKKCDTGPTRLGTCPLAEACCPQRTWTNARKSAALILSFLAIAFLLAASQTQWVADFFKPGELATPHAQILAGTLSSQRCAACHAEASIQPTSWFRSAGAGHDHVTQTDRCLDCHHTTIDRSTARLAHNLPAEARKQIRDLALQNSGNTVATQVSHHAPSPAVNQERLECSACHREHRGADANLMVMTDAQCQTCHQNQFGSFATSHPQWSDWPYGRGGKIAFDHSSHATKHFPASSQGENSLVFNCIQCHPKNENNELRRTVDYEVACQSCHDKGLKLESTHGIELFALPTIPEERSRAFESWPVAATGFYDGTIAPLAELLLRSEKELTAAMRTIEDRDFSRVRADSPDQAAAAATIAQAHRTLLADVAARGQPALIQRAEAGGVSSAALRNIIRSIPPQMLADTYRLWFHNANEPESLTKRRSPHRSPFRLVATTDDLLLGDNEDLLTDDDLLSPDPLSTDPQNSDPLSMDLLDADPLDSDPLDAGNQQRTTKQRDTRFDPNRMLAEGGWYRDELRLAIVYRGGGHADPIIRSAIETLAALPANDPLRTRMLANRTVAACISCHPSASMGGGNWVSPALVGQGRTFTKFSHKPHMNIAGLTDCVHCHEVSKTHADFEPIKLQSCAACHTAHGAGESCTTCHLYHVDSF